MGELCKRLEFRHSDTWYMRKQESALENEKHQRRHIKFSWTFKYKWITKSRVISKVHLLEGKRTSDVQSEKKKAKISTSN